MDEVHTLVLGVGNLLLGDEGVGVHVARRLLQSPLPPGVEVVDGGTAGFELIRFCAGKKRIIIIDALLGDAEPGSIVRCTPAELHLAPEAPSTAHGVDLKDLLRQVQAFSPKPDVVIFGIIPLSSSEPTTELTPLLKSRLDDIVGAILGELSLQSGGDSRMLG